jgi:uncharacterized RDD family membrane protein YckC
LQLDLPEHGQLQLPLAGVGTRLAAALIDMAIMAAFGMLVFLLAMVGAGIGAEEVTLPAAFALMCLLPVLGPMFFEARWRGQTPGKRVMSLRVIARDGTPASGGQLFLRNVLRLVDFLPFGYFAGLAAMFASSQSQRLGDLVGGTVVVREDARALVELGAVSEVQHTDELYGIPDAVLRAAALLLDPTRTIDADSLRSRRHEVASLVRKYRPDLAAENDEAVWIRLNRGVKRP